MIAAARRGGVEFNAKRSRSVEALYDPASAVIPTCKDARRRWSPQLPRRLTLLLRPVDRCLFEFDDHRAMIRAQVGADDSVMDSDLITDKHVVDR